MRGRGKKKLEEVKIKGNRNKKQRQRGRRKELVKKVIMTLSLSLRVPDFTLNHRFNRLGFGKRFQ